VSKYRARGPDRRRYERAVAFFDEIYPGLRVYCDAHRYDVLCDSVRLVGSC